MSNATSDLRKKLVELDFDIEEKAKICVVLRTNIDKESEALSNAEQQVAAEYENIIEVIINHRNHLLYNMIVFLFIFSLRWKDMVKIWHDCPSPQNW